MANNVLAGSESRFNQLRRLIVPDALWQLTWLRHLPRYYRSVIWNECHRSRRRVIRDLLHIFFRLKTVPEHYVPCRLWERPPGEWPLYYGSPYTPIQRGRLARDVYPFEYQILFNDKVVGARLTQSLHDVRQPRIFGMLQPDESYREKLAGFMSSNGTHRLMLKPVFGRSGLGIVMLERNDSGGRITVRTAEGRIPLEQLRLDCPVFYQEVIQQDPRLAAIWNSAVNTCRIITLQTKSGEVMILGGALRFGVGESYVDNWSAGGVAVGIDSSTGRLRKIGSDRDGKLHAAHPSSGFTFENFEIPQWPRLLDTARSIQKAIPFSKVLGLDLCLADDGTPVLIEINGLPDFVFIEQLNGPLLADPVVRKAFEEYGLLG